MTTGIHPTLSLGRTISDENYSIIHQLFKNNKIPNKQFALCLSNRVLYFGGIPNHVIHNKPLLKLQSINKNNGWTFLINSIVIGNIELHVNKQSIKNNLKSNLFFIILFAKKNNIINLLTNVFSYF